MDCPKCGSEFDQSHTNTAHRLSPSRQHGSNSAGGSTGSASSSSSSSTAGADGSKMNGAGTRFIPARCHRGRNAPVTRRRSTNCYASANMNSGKEAGSKEQHAAQYKLRSKRWVLVCWHTYAAARA